MSRNVGAEQKHPPRQYCAIHAWMGSRLLISSRASLRLLRCRFPFPAEQHARQSERVSCPPIGNAVLDQWGESLPSYFCQTQTASICASNKVRSKVAQSDAAMSNQSVWDTGEVVRERRRVSISSRSVSDTRTPFNASQVLNIMASAQIQTLLLPPKSATSEEHAIALLNTSFTSLVSLNAGSALDDAIESARARADDCSSQVRLGFIAILPKSSLPSGSSARCI